jgi:hypothetical protein
VAISTPSFAAAWCNGVPPDAIARRPDSALRRNSSRTTRHRPAPPRDAAVSVPRYPELEHRAVVEEQHDDFRLRRRICLMQRLSLASGLPAHGRRVALQMTFHIIVVAFRDRFVDVSHTVAGRHRIARPTRPMAEVASASTRRQPGDAARPRPEGAKANLFFHVGERQSRPIRD